jgi:hypothetical protein
VHPRRWVSRPRAQLRTPGSANRSAERDAPACAAAPAASEPAGATQVTIAAYTAPPRGAAPAAYIIEHGGDVARSAGRGTTAADGITDATGARGGGV